MGNEGERAHLRQQYRDGAGRGEPPE